MLTAKEARDIALRSDAEIERHATLITKKIEELALRGKYEMRLTEANYLDQQYGFTDLVVQSYSPPKLSAFQEDLKKKLTSLGYHWSVEQQMNDPKRIMGYMPDGSSNDDPYPSYYIKISW